ncbi:DNA-binding protein [Salmonella enterica]|nr:DNA-binding protein [Salmonella enterica]
MIRRIEDAAMALIAEGIPYPTNAQVRDRLGSGSFGTISPVMNAFRARQRELASEQIPALPPELAQLLTGQLTRLWQAAVKQADADTLAAREQADADITQADQERDEALARVAALKSELAAQLKEEKVELKAAREENRALQGELLNLARNNGKTKK